MRKRALLVGLALWMVSMGAGLGGCKTYRDYDAFLKTPRPVVGGKPYVIEPPDSIRIIAPSAPELNNVTARLRPDGFITLYLLGDIFAAGKTPTHLAAELEEQILKYYEDVTVQVQVVGFNSKFYYMTGETRPGPQPFTGRDTVLDAVLRAGIPFTAWAERAVLIRPNEEGELIKRMTINLKDMTRLGDLKYNAVLEEGDLIYIPVNPLAAFGRHIQLLLAPINPLIQAAAAPARVTSVPGL